MNHEADPVGTLADALAHAARLLEGQPRLAVEQAEEVLKLIPGQPAALLLRALAKRALGAAEEALSLLQSLSSAEPGFALAHCELGVTLRGLA